MIQCKVAFETAAEGVDETVQAAAFAQRIDAAAQRRQQCRPDLRRRQFPPRQRLDGEHPVDVGAEQPEHPGHAGLRGDAGELGLHALEQRAGRFGAQVADGDAIARRGVGVHHQDRCLRIGEDVLAGLVEELEGQRDVVLVYVHQLRDVGDVGRAVRAAGGDA